MKLLDQEKGNTGDLICVTKLFSIFVPIYVSNNHLWELSPTNSYLLGNK